MMLGDRVGYVLLTPVSETSAQDLTDAVNGLVQKGMKSLVLDLRGNPGGLLDQGVAVSELFLDPGQEVVETRGRAPTTSKTYRDAKPQPWPNLPVVVLTNGGTASAAEIITGALQDHDRAVVVGTPTFGKGLVQSLWQLTPETALKLTTARWFTPSGRTIQRKSKNEEDQLAQAEAAELGHDSTRSTPRWCSTPIMVGLSWAAVVSGRTCSLCPIRSRRRSAPSSRAWATRSRPIGTCAPPTRSKSRRPAG